MAVLLSIKPKYVELIKAGFKKYEFRKKVFKKIGSRIFIYSSSPVKKIIGFFEAPVIYEDRPIHIWNRFGDYSGLSESEFFRYFKGRKKGYAIEIRNLTVFKNPLDPLERFKTFKAPQSFYYFNLINYH
jgi:predicted transcriptional regulator